MGKPVLKNWSGGHTKRYRWRSPAVHRGAAIFMAAAVVALAPVAVAVEWKSSERDVPVATDHGFAVSATVAEVVYKTAPFEIVVVVDNPTDRAVEITVFHRDSPLEPAIRAMVFNGSYVSLLPVLPDGVAVQSGGFIGKPGQHAYKIPARGSLSFGAEVDWLNYADRIDRINSGHNCLLVYFNYELGDNTVPYWSKSKEDPAASNDSPAEQAMPELHRVSWYFPIEIRDTEAGSPKAAGLERSKAQAC